MSITANDFTRLHRGNELVSCRSCERILYLAESTAATW
jgi:predicted  nucleic acid-binding Zn-ribbon protein